MNTDIAFALAIELMDEHGLTEDGWSFKFDNARRRFGLCRYHSKQISLSRYLTELNDEEHVRDTILHEIAHALAGYRRTGGRRVSHHDAEFYAMCRKVGATPRRCYSEHVETPDHKWEGTCTTCGKVYKRHRLKRAAKQMACGPCCKRYNGNKWSERFTLQWRDVSNATARV